MNSTETELNPSSTWTLFGRPWWVVMLPFLAAFFVFIQILWAGWVYDDIELFKINPQMEDWNLLWRTFTMPYWQITSISEIHTGYYRPIGGASYLLLHKLGGGDPFYFHLASLIMHSLCSLFVARLAIQIGLSNLAAVLAGISFAVFGSHVDAVAWASSLPDILAAFFSLLALSSFLKQKLLAPAIWLALALMSKESAIATLLLMLGITIWGGPKPAILLGLKPTRASWRLPRFAVLVVVAALVYTARCFAFDSLYGGFDITTTHHYLTPGHQILLSLGLIAKYIGFLFWPLPNIPFQPLEVGLSPQDLALTRPAFIGAAILLCSMVLWFWRSRKSMLLMVGLGLLFAGLAPVLKTTSIGRYPFEQRFLYLPSLGFALLMGYWLAQIARKAGRLPMLIPAGFLLAVNLYSTLGATPKWKDDLTFFTWTRANCPNAMTPYLNLARIYLEQAETFPEGHPTRISLAEKAFTEYENSLTVDPDQWLVVAIERENGNVGMGDALFMVGEYGTAEAVYRETLKPKGYPNSIYAHVGLAQCLLLRAERRAVTHSWKEVVPIWEEALLHAKLAVGGIRELPGAHHAVSVALYSLGHLPEALAPAIESIRLKPNYYPYSLHLVELYFLLNDLPKIRETLEAFLLVAPQSEYRAEAEETIKLINQQLGSSTSK